MSHIIRINDDQLDEIVRSELEFQRDCCDPSETDLIQAFNKVIEVFTPASEIIEREQRARSQVVDNAVCSDEGYPPSTYMYGLLDNVPSEPSNVRVSYHFGV